MLEKLKNKDSGTDWFAWFVYGSVLLLIAMLFFVEIPQTNRDIIFMAMGALVGYQGAVVSFKYGSSKDSMDKDKMLHQKVPILPPGSTNFNITEVPKEETPSPETKSE